MCYYAKYFDLCYYIRNLLLIQLLLLLGSLFAAHFFFVVQSCQPNACFQSPSHRGEWVLKTQTTSNKKYPQTFAPMTEWDESVNGAHTQHPAHSAKHTMYNAR